MRWLSFSVPCAKGGQPGLITRPRTHGIMGVGLRVYIGFRAYRVCLGFSEFSAYSLGHFQMGSYRYRSLIEGLYTLKKPYRSPVYPELPTCSFP